MSEQTIAGRRLSRRNALGIGAAGAAGLALGASRLGGWGAQPALAAGDPLVEPQILESVNGKLNVTLEGKIRPVVVDGVSKNMWVYNGQLPGPTLKLSPGDQLKLKFKNRLAEMSNMHYHGLHVAPGGISDNVFLHVDPGADQEYVLDIPKKHEPGLNWYHPHMHELGTQQMFGGMSGAMIIKGGLDNVKNIAALPDRVFVLQATKFSGADVATFGGPDSRTGDPVSFVHLVNGQVEPVIPMKTDRYQRWRFVNATINVFYRLELEGHEMIQIAADGHTFNEYYHTNAIELVPGARIEVLVKAGFVGTYDLVGTILVRPGQPTPVTLATANVRPTFGPNPTTSLHALPQFVDLRTLPVARQRELHFDFGANVFTIDGQVFDPNRIDQVVKLGDVEEWTMFNDQVAPAPVPHPFHIHTNPFQVTKVNGVPMNARSYEDTVNIPGSGSLTVLIRFLDFTGKAVYHCHIIPHADFGMMGTFKVTKSGELAEPLVLGANGEFDVSEAVNPLYCDIPAAAEQGALVAEPALTKPQLTF